MAVRSFDESMVELLDSMGTERRVVNAARVSFNRFVDETQPLSDQDKRLIAYLADHRHDSPFHHVILCFRLKMPIFVAREWFRHTIGFARNEVSRRYVDVDVECFVPNRLRSRHPSKKQGSLEAPPDKEEELLAAMRQHALGSMELYDRLLQDGVAPEQARIVLPQGMYTTFIETASLSAYMRLLGLRLGEDAQVEIRAYARIVLERLKEAYPNLVDALLQH